MSVLGPGSRFKLEILLNTLGIGEKFLVFCRNISLCVHMHTLFI